MASIPRGELAEFTSHHRMGHLIARNRSIFLDKDTPFEAIAIQCTSIYTNIPKPVAEKMPKQVSEEQIKDDIPWAYFDGASQNNRTGAGLVIHINQNQCLKPLWV